MPEFVWRRGGGKFDAASPSYATSSMSGHLC
jgi:hypothetical protein